jgi:hypothetical protein
MSPIAPLIFATIISPADNGMWQMNSLAYENPAVKQWMLPDSYNSIEVGYHKAKADEAVNVPEDGIGDNYWHADANAYMKYKSSTLWGAASYRNGHQRNIVWNETSDADIIYPYFTADSIGGDMSMERYHFSGGYADHTDKWAWGVTLGYTAGQYYRNVDPRPKNVTGKLDLSIGGGRLILNDSYFIGASVNWYKYKQSNDIDFKSQTGVEKIYHLTGLGTDYTRFAGTGMDVYYSGNCPGVSVNLFPTKGSGLVASASFNRLTLNKILNDLNKLPLTNINHKELNAQLGWLSYGAMNDWGVTATLKIYRRHGTENIFGDAASSIYPQIGSLFMYADNAVNLNLSGLWQHRWGDKMILWLRPEVGYAHRTTAYREPARYQTLNQVSPGITASLTSRLGKKWSGSLTAAYHSAIPFNSELYLSDTSTNSPSLINAIEQSYTFASEKAQNFQAELRVARSISEKYGLSLAIEWDITAYCNSVNRNNIDLNVAFTF